MNRTNSTGSSHPFGSSNNNSFRNNPNSFSTCNNSTSQAVGNSVYVLKLENARWYVGKTSKPVEERYMEHVRGQGAAWTRLHQPIQVHYTVTSASEHQEDNTTIEMMRVYGIDNVRGGIYCETVLSPDTIHSIKGRIAGLSDMCLRCFRTNHFAKDCKATTDKYGNSIEHACGKGGQNVQPQRAQDLRPSPASETSSQRPANREARAPSKTSNKASNIPASSAFARALSLPTQPMAAAPVFPFGLPAGTFKVEEKDLTCFKPHCTRCFRTTHSVKECYATTDAFGQPLDSEPEEEEEEEGVCFRCGRAGHFAVNRSLPVKLLRGHRCKRQPPQESCGDRCAKKG